MPLEESEVSPQLSAGMARAMQHPEVLSAAASAYVAWLGYYNSNLRRLGWSQRLLVDKAADWSRCMGLHETPALQKKTIGMMGLKGVPGLRIQ